MGAPRGNQNRWKHGRRSRESRALLAESRALIREIKMILGKSRRPLPNSRRRGSSAPSTALCAVPLPRESGGGQR